MDKTIAETKPFLVIKEDEEIGKTLIATCVQQLTVIAQALVPFLPDTSEKILSLIRENKKPETPLFARLA